MPRITVDISDATLAQIDAEVKLQKVSRSKWAATAIDAHLQQERITSDAEVHQLEERVMQLQQQLDAKNNIILNLNTETERLSNELKTQKELITKENFTSDRFYEILVQSANDGISFYDIDWNLKYANA